MTMHTKKLDTDKRIAAALRSAKRLKSAIDAIYFAKDELGPRAGAIVNAYDHLKRLCSSLECGTSEQWAKDEAWLKSVRKYEPEEPVK